MWIDNQVKRKVENIVKNVKKKGDAALFEISKKFDGVVIDKKNISIELKKIKVTLNTKTKKAIDSAFENLVYFFQKEKKTIKPLKVKRNGLILQQIPTPIEKIGLYIPGGNYTYPSTVLACGVAATVAGVKEIYIATPPKKITEELIYASKLVDVKKIFRVGGPAAIAAFAYGTDSIPKVDKIFGPGNIYVTEAKRQLFGDCGIDLLAGPSELAIIADEYGDVDFIVTDLLAQCEHDKSAKGILISNSKKILQDVKNKIGKNFSNQIKFFYEKNVKRCFDIANNIAPEHLEIFLKNANNFLNLVKNCGAVFIGKNSASALGDYVSGPSHILPTNGTARWSSGLSVKDFVKYINVVYYKKNIKTDLETAIKFAEIEKMNFHKKSLEIRMK